MKVHGVFLVAVLFYLAYTQLVEGQPRKDCQTRCGNLTIEYPFGTSPGCYYADDSSFNLTCNDKEKLLFGSNFEVINITHSGELRVMNNVSYTCYDIQGNFNRTLSYNYSLANLSFSRKNKFTLVGCNALALLSTCASPPAANGECNGSGCCRTDVSVPYDSYSFQTLTDLIPCTYAFLVEDGKFNFSSSEDLKNLRNVTEFPMVLHWSIGDQTCEQAGNRSICGMNNSTCFNSARGAGYNCKCLKGFEGNPYLSSEHGCQDINECTSTIHKHNCADPNTCRNTVGGFYCKCRSGYRLDTTTMSCKRREFGWATILLGITIGFLAILLVISCVQQKMKHRKNTELRQQFFTQNGGGMLIQRLSGAGLSNVDFKIFTEEGMKEATNGYDERNILGQGGQGTVYKGILPDNSIVAIKKSRLVDRSQMGKFINEVLVLSQINHRNVVKLLGCCLETEVPLLVYEFVTNGTFSDHLHGSMSDSSLTWEQRLRIAVEISGSLAYLHSSASIPIIHRDVKTANILLDENVTAKVADFGASRLIPMDKEQLTTMVQDLG
ncbi:hypothetical protein Bca52824_012824 [Brassica carinata]|uniref:Uncharacterized protein n=1 Tax=Brassica carinata TaxID=52824 RepID=A0A8X7VXJ1_BRACI|nr:hypothetical protein Bca52824_012824 [Brassica carinata]